MKIPLERIGNGINFCGVVLGNADEYYVALLPDEEEPEKVDLEVYSAGDWKALLDRMDNVFIKIQGKDGVVKAMIRKADRLIDKNLQWQVFKRDGYRCQYCGKTGVPMTVDHYMPQELGGETKAENLKTCCRSCNKRKGDMHPNLWEALMVREGL